MGKTSCKKGQYYCNTDKKCKPIPDGYKVREDGFLVSEGSNPRIPRKAGQPAKSKKHSDLYTDEDPKGTIHGLGFKDVATAKASVAKIRKSSRSHAHKIQAAIAMEQRARVMGKTAEAAIFRKYINSMKKKTKAMNEEKKGDHEYEMIRRQTDNIIVNAKKLKKKVGKGEGEAKAWVQSKITKAADYLDTAADYMTDKDNVKEGTLRSWFKGSKSKDGKGGWVNVKTGGTCASDEPGEGVPKCVSRAKYDSMSKKERESAHRRKRDADPGQQEKTNAAKPTYVSTDKKSKKKKKMKKESTEFTSLPLVLEVPQNAGEFKCGLMFRESLEQDRGMLFIFESDDYWTFHMKNTFIPLDIAFIKEDGTIDSIKELEPMSSIPVYPDNEIRYAVEVNRGWFAENDVNVGDALLEDLQEHHQKDADGNTIPHEGEELNEVKDKKGKGSGTKDACYHKVKSRYSVWPSAYASGALVKCRKVGAANWGNKSESVEDEVQLIERPDPYTTKVPRIVTGGGGGSGHTPEDKKNARIKKTGQPKNINSHYNWRDSFDNEELDEQLLGAIKRAGSAIGSAAQKVGSAVGSAAQKVGSALKPKPIQGRVSQSNQNMAGKTTSGGGQQPVSQTPASQKMGATEVANRERLGNERVDALKAKNAQFQAAKKAGPEAMKQYRADNPQLSGRERAQAMARARLAAKKVEASAPAAPKPTVDKF